MQKKAFRSITYVLITLLASANAWSQNLSRSPYSVVGLGDLQFTGTIRQTALGQTGIALSDSFEINNLNPASYSNLRYTVFEGAYTYTGGRISNSISGANTVNGTFSYFMLGFPLWQKIGWGFSMGLQPYTGLGYNVRLRSSFNNVETLTDMSGRGGLTRVYSGTGVRIFKGLTAGVNFSYLFGQTTQTNLLSADIASNFFSISNERVTSIGDFMTDWGLQYNFKPAKNYRTTMGLVMQQATSLRATQDYVYRTTTPDGSFTIDTVDQSLNNRGAIQLPLIYGAGLSIKHINPETNQDHWLFTIQAKQGMWQDFSFFGRPDSMVNNLQLNAGFSIIPVPNKGKNIFSKTEYRVGFRMDNGNIRLSGTNISTMAISAGVGVPLGKSKSRLNITGEYLRRGTHEQNLLREEYFRLSLGITILDRWFMRYRYD